MHNDIDLSVLFFFTPYRRKIEGKKDKGPWNLSKSNMLFLGNPYEEINLLHQSFFLKKMINVENILISQKHYSAYSFSTERKRLRTFLPIFKRTLFYCQVGT